ncbi:MAG: manganese efflux pump [Clostridia bacterium]|nr:manganese efflux pump [Clostridia bacterium]
MQTDLIMLFTNSLLLGAGLAMDAFSVSLANGLNDPKMKKGRIFLIAGVFAVFQTLMPLTGWFCVHTIAQYFDAFQKFIPWIALVLLCFIGGKMLKEGIQNKENDEAQDKKLTFSLLLVQGVATSIDALSVGFTIADYNLTQALVSTLIIGAVTFAICTAGIIIGKKFGTKLSNKASIFGGVILIFIGIEIFVTGII